MADPALLIYGPEQLLVDRTIAKALKKIRATAPDVQVTTLDAAADDAAGEFAQAASPTLFGDGVCVIVTNAESADETLAAALVEAAERQDPWLIVVHPGGVKGKRMLDALRAAGAVQVDCPAIKKGRPMLDHLAKEVAAHKRSTTADALPALIEALGPDIAMLTAAIDQLVSDIDHDPITAADVRSTFGGVAEIAGWTIADRVWERKMAEALSDLRWSMQSTDGARLGPSTIAALSRGLRSMILVGTSPPGASDADIARDVGVPPWQIKTLRRQWSTWSGDRRRIARAIVELAESDGAMKGGVGTALDSQQKLYALERLVVQLTARQN
jgi:DNA polymerase-3 subunit delta